MYDRVCTPLYWPAKYRRGKGIVYYKRHSLSFRYPGKGFKRRNVHDRIAYGFSYYPAGLIIYRLLHLTGMVTVHKYGVYAKPGKYILEKRKRPAVYFFGYDHVVTAGT